MRFFVFYQRVSVFRYHHEPCAWLMVSVERDVISSCDASKNASKNCPLASARLCQTLLENFTISICISMIYRAFVACFRQSPQDLYSLPLNRRRRL